MLDIRQIRENPEKIKKRITRKGVDAKTIDTILVLDQEYRTLIKQVEDLKARKNKESEKISKADSTTRHKLIEEMKKVDEEQDTLDKKLKTVKEKLDVLLIELPNPPLDSVPDGKDTNENVVIKTIGEKPKFSFKTKDHLDLGLALNLLDIESASISSGARFYYLKNEAVLLEFALVEFILKKLIQKGFTPIIPPVLVQEKAMFGTGFFPADRNQIYQVNAEEDHLYLVGTAEVPLCMLHYNKIIPEKSLPLRYVGFSSCFRREAGTYGKDTRGIFRVHQFDKIEMFSFTTPKESEKEHEFLRSIEEEIMQDLGFHYQIVNICTGDLGAPAAKKYDIEVWLPGQNAYRELTSCSNCTDFQARRSNIRYKTTEGKNEILHTLNGTACAIGRTLIALLENYQQEDGSMRVPKVLQDFIGKDCIGMK